MLGKLRAGNTSRKELDPVAQKRIAQQIREAADQANGKWAALGRIEAEYAANRKWRTADLYALYATSRDIVVGDPILNWTVVSGAISALVAFLVGSWIVCILLLLSRTRWSDAWPTLKRF